MSELRIYIYKHIRMFNIEIVYDKDIDIEYECVRLDSSILPIDIETFFPGDWFSHQSGNSVWDYIVWDFIEVKMWDIIIKCTIPTDEQIDKSELLSYKSDSFLKSAHYDTSTHRKIWLGRWWRRHKDKMVFVLRSEDAHLLYSKSAYDNFSYLKI